MVIYSSETSADFQRTTWCYFPEDSILHIHRCENLKSYMNYVIPIALQLFFEVFLAPINI
jgi:hypothetical protein